jgi:hypothetical protein
MVSTVKEQRQRLVEQLKDNKKRQPQPITCPPGQFFCDGHLEFLPLEQQSTNPRFCKGCLAVIEDATAELSKDYWVKDVFITGGKGYGLTADLRTVCVGTEADVLARVHKKPLTPIGESDNGALQKPHPTSTTTPGNLKGPVKPQKQTQKALQKPLSGGKTIGRPKKDLPVERVMALHKKGLGARAIANELWDDGIKVSYLTVHRLIQGQLALLPLES